MTRSRSGMFAALLGLAVLGSFAPLAAQQAPHLTPGQRVRVTIPSALEKQRATVLAMAADSITLSLDTRGDFFAKTHRQVIVALGSLSSLEVSNGTANNAAIGAVIGGAAGAIFGVIEVKRENDACHRRGGWFCDLLPPAAGLLLGVPVAGIGTLVGLLVRTERWEKVPLDRLRLGIVAQPSGRLGLGAALAF